MPRRRTSPFSNGGTTDANEDIEFVDVPWTEWKRTFLFLPKETITGNEIIGFAWTRMLECRVREYENDVGYYLATGNEWIEYARNKKEIFLHNLKGEEDGLVV